MAIKVGITFDDTSELYDFFSMMSKPEQKGRTVEKTVAEIVEETDGISEGMEESHESLDIPIVFDQDEFNRTYDYDAISCTFKTKKGKSRFWVTGTEGVDILIYWDEGLSYHEIYNMIDWTYDKRVTENTISHFIRRCKEGKMYWAFRNICENPLMNEDFSIYEKILMKMREE